MRRARWRWGWPLVCSLALVVIVTTIPVLLFEVGGWPLAHLGYRQLAGGLSSRQPFDAAIAVHWLARGALLVAWLSWAWMTSCVVLELRAWSTGRSPVRLPASRALQSAAACLVGTALAVSVAGRAGSAVPAVMNPSAVAAGGHPPALLRVIDDLDTAEDDWPTTTPVLVGASVNGPVIRLTDPPVEPETDRVGAFSAADGLRTGSTPVAVVHQVVHRETLWSIATERLGSSRRWREIADLNYGIPQADGGALGSDHWIRPGWRLRLPRGEADEPQPADEDRWSPPEAATGPSGGADHPIRGEPLLPVGGSVVGAGVTGLLDRMRRAQQRHRGTGRLISLPDPRRRLVEQRLRMGDGAVVTSMIDTALRSMGRHWRDCPGEVPVVRGIRVQGDAVELVVDRLDPTAGLPQHFALQDDAASVIVDRSALTRRSWAAHAPDEGKSPAPLLVTAGSDEDGAVMVNLEALGSLVVDGDADGCDRVVRALALELATSRWGGQFELVLVGFGAELERFTSVRSTTDVAALVRDLCCRRIEAHRLLGTADYRSFAEGRVVDGSDRWDPTVVICGSTVDEAQAGELLEAASDPDAGMAVVMVGPRTGATHSVRLTGGRAPSPLDLLGSVVFPQMVGVEELSDVSGLLELAAHRESVLSSDEPYVHLAVPIPVITGDSPEDSPRGRSAAGVTDSHRPPVGPSPMAAVGDEPPEGVVVVNVLGPVEVRGATREFTRAWAKELVVYLAMHPDGASNEAWATALWPDRLMAPSSLHSTASVARRALGQGPGGIDHLPAFPRPAGIVPDGRHRLGSVLLPGRVGRCRGLESGPAPGAGPTLRRNPLRRLADPRGHRTGHRGIGRRPEREAGRSMSRRW